MIFSDMGDICKICKKDGSLFETHSFTNSNLIILSWVGLQYMWCNVKKYRLFETTYGEIAYGKGKKLCLRDLWF